MKVCFLPPTPTSSPASGPRELSSCQAQRLTHTFTQAPAAATDRAACSPSSGRNGTGRAGLGRDGTDPSRDADRRHPANAAGQGALACSRGAREGQRSTQPSLRRKTRTRPRDRLRAKGSLRGFTTWEAQSFDVGSRVESGGTTGRGRDKALTLHHTPCDTGTRRARGRSLGFCQLIKHFGVHSVSNVFSPGTRSSGLAIVSVSQHAYGAP